MANAPKWLNICFDPVEGKITYLKNIINLKELKFDELLNRQDNTYFLLIAIICVGLKTKSIWNIHLFFKFFLFNINK